MRTHYNCHSRESGNLYNKNHLWIPLSEGHALYQVRDDKVTSRFASLSRRIFWTTSCLTTYYLLLTTPAYAACVDSVKGVQIGECFGFGDIHSFGQGITQLVAPVFSVAAAAVIIYFLIGAFKFLASGGDKEQIAGGRQILTHSIIGFILLIFAFVIIQFLLSSLFGISGLHLF